MIRNKQRITGTVIFSFILVLLCLPLLTSDKAFAASNYIDDEASLLNSDEITKLNEEIEEFKNSYDTNIYIATITTLGTKDKYDYAHILAENNDIGNGIVILYDYENNEKGKRTLVIQSHRDDISSANTLAYDYITPNRCDRITNSISSYFVDRDYYNGFHKAISLLSDKITVSPDKENSFIYSIWGKSWVQLLISLAIGAIIVAIMLFNAGGKITTNSNTYLNQQHSGLIGRYDHYIRTQTTRRKRETSSSNGSERSGGGGSSHGGSSTF